LSVSAELVCIHPQYLREVWPLVESRLRAAYLRPDLGHTADIERDLFEGDGLLWCAVVDGDIQAAAVTVLCRTDRNLVCNITAVGGENRERWFDLLEEIEDWAKQEGAAKMRIFGRKGWLRLLKNYRAASVVLERAL